MFRLVLLSSLSVLVLRPAFAQDESSPVLSAGAKPGSSIARSVFASTQRDTSHEHSPAVRPTLQVAIPSPTTAATPAESSAVAATPPKGALKPRIAAPSAPTVTIPVLSAPVPIPIIASPTSAPKNEVSKTGGVGSTAASAASEKPKLNGAPAIPTTVGPKVLASREAMRQRVLLARLESNLAAEEPRLNRAAARLSQSQRQLGAFTSVLRSAMLEAGDEGGGLHPFVRVAQRYVGTPYVWGGESARGFDCSGFIMRVMRDLGYKALPHSAAEQFRYGAPIARGLLKPGDIVFFANTYKPGISHVGIYLGRGRFIHAANSKVGTIISNLNESKWVAHYAGARRLIRAS